MESMEGNTMKTIVIAAVVALAFTTGFTCSKNPPAETAVPAQDQMAAPVDATVTTMPGEMMPTTTMPH